MPRARSHEHAPHGNVVPIAGRVEPLRCSHCRSCDVVQVDLIECVYRVQGVREPGIRVLVDIGGREYDHEAIADQYYRCRECASEWPLDPGTVFMDSGADR